jgi:hypothetical protein
MANIEEEKVETALWHWLGKSFEEPHCGLRMNIVKALNRISLIGTFAILICRLNDNHGYICQHTPGP